MIFFDILIERALLPEKKDITSSWLADIDFVFKYPLEQRKAMSADPRQKMLSREGKLVIQTKQGYKYEIVGATYPLYVNWLKAPSKGKFYNKNIVKKYNHKRIA